MEVGRRMEEEGLFRSVEGGRVFRDGMVYYR